MRQIFYRTIRTALTMSAATATTNNAAILSAPNIPQVMTAVQGKDYGPIDEMISVESNVPVPRLADLPPKKQKSHVLIQTYAVALAPGDCRVLSGLTRELQGPPSFPYVPGGDACGKVVEIPADNEHLPFQLGDVVAARFGDGPRGALGEYALVSSSICDKIPSDSISVDEAAALAGATPSTLIADNIVQGERVLILGAGGGEGSHLVQHVKRMGASLVVGVSKDPERLLKEPLSYDRAIDYTKEDVFDMEEFKKEPFDTIIDLAAGGWPKLAERAAAGKPLIVKTASEGGRFWTPTPDKPIFEAHSIGQILGIFLWPSLGRAISSRSWRRWKMPKFTYTMAIPSSGDVMTRTLQLAKENKLKAVLDPKGPFPFTTEGVREAFKTQESRHPKGKVVIHVADPKV